MSVLYQRFVHFLVQSSKIQFCCLLPSHPQDCVITEFCVEGNPVLWLSPHCPSSDGAFHSWFSIHRPSFLLALELALGYITEYPTLHSYEGAASPTPHSSCSLVFSFRRELSVLFRTSHNDGCEASPSLVHTVAGGYSLPGGLLAAKQDSRLNGHLPYRWVWCPCVLSLQAVLYWNFLHSISVNPHDHLGRERLTAVSALQMDKWRPAEIKKLAWSNLIN